MAFFDFARSWLNPFGGSGTNNPFFGDNGLFSNPSGAWDKYKNGNTNETYAAVQSETNETNKEIADQNLQFQRENLDYQKALQQQIFEREDSAYSRTAKDMRAAGLSPLMMNGTNGAGEAIQTQPLNNSYQHQGRPVANSGASDVVPQIFNAIAQMASVRQAQEKNEADISVANAQARNLDSITNFNNSSSFARLVGLELDNKNKGAQYNSIINMAAQTMLQNQGLALANRNEKFMQDYFRDNGLNPAMSFDERNFALVRGLAGVKDTDSVDDMIEKINDFFDRSSTFGSNHMADFFHTSEYKGRDIMQDIFAGATAGGRLVSSILDIFKPKFLGNGKNKNKSNPFNDYWEKILPY